MDLCPKIFLIDHKISRVDKFRKDRDPENYLMARLRRSIIVVRRYLYASSVRRDIPQDSVTSNRESWLL